MALYLYYELVFKVFGHNKNFTSKWLLSFKAQKIILLQFLTLSKNLGFSYRKYKDDICN